jgi:hypothetical protein
MRTVPFFSFFCYNKAMRILQVFCAAVGALAGFCIALKPASVIEIQKRFYAGINWRIEPISMQKELRNTRIMGICVCVISAAALMWEVFF